MMVYSEMRPPVAAEDGNTPLRGKHVSKLLDLAASEYYDEAGFRLTKDDVLKNYNDGARLTDKHWNNRHHVTPSMFNANNHRFYKVGWLYHICNWVWLVCSNTSTKTSKTRTTCLCSRRDIWTLTKRTS